MFLLIDAFNLIYKFPDLELCMYQDRLEDARNGLLEILQEVKSKSEDLRILLFVDGVKAKGDLETYQEEKDGIQIFYSHEKEADDIIRVYIMENAAPNLLTLVTSDKKVIQFAKQFKVKCITSEAYSRTVREILENAKPDDPCLDKIGISDSDISEWMNTFSGRSTS